MTRPGRTSAGGLAELVLHYAHALAIAPSPAVYGELLSARSFAGTLLSRSAPRQRPALTVTAGWLSSLLAISAADLGDHAAAVIWCADTERRGRDAAYPELLGWAALTRSLIAWYQGDPLASAAAARRGQADGQPGSVAHAKLAAQEMPCRAMLADAAVHRDIAAAGGQVRRGSPDDTADHRPVPRFGMASLELDPVPASRARPGCPGCLPVTQRVPGTQAATAAVDGR